MMCCRGHPEAPIQLATCLSPLGSPTSSATSLHCLDCLIMACVFELVLLLKNSADFLSLRVHLQSRHTHSLFISTCYSHIHNYKSFLGDSMRRKERKEKSASSAHRTTSESADVLCCYNYRIFNEITQSLVPAFGQYFFPASLISLNFIIKLSSFKLCYEMHRNRNPGCLTSFLIIYWRKLSRLVSGCGIDGC